MKGDMNKMKKMFIYIAVSILLVGLLAAPSLALSATGEDFVRYCYTLDAPFPPPDWDKADLRDAALDVLQEAESGYLDSGLINFCLIALGSVGDTCDLDVIMSYSDDMPRTVLRALNGFTHPEAIDYLLYNVESDKITTRELAVLSLEKMDFKKLDKPMDWYEKVRSKLIEVLNNEKEEWLRNDIQNVIDNLMKPPVENI